MVTIVVDAANVMGSRPDGWWRDRAGAAVRLYRDLAWLAAQGEEGPEGHLAPARIAVPGLSGEAEIDFLLVLEGAARAAMDRISAADDGALMDKHIRVVAASGSGDDAIVSAVRELTGRCVVVTADRELRRRCEALGASILGPGWLLGQFQRQHRRLQAHRQAEVSGRPTRSAGRPTSPLAPVHFDTGCRIVAGEKPCPPGFAG